MAACGIPVAGRSGEVLSAAVGALRQAGLASALAYLGLAVPRLQRGPHPWLQHITAHRWWPWVLGHVGTCGLFGLWTARVFAPEAAAVPHQAMWALGWLLLGAATLLLALGVALLIGPGAQNTRFDTAAMWLRE